MEDATVATNASDDDAQHDPKQCTEQNQNEQQQEEEEEAEHQQQQQQNTLLILYTQNVPGPGQAAMPRSMQLFAPFSQVAHFISKYNETKPNKTKQETKHKKWKTRPKRQTMEAATAHDDDDEEEECMKRGEKGK